jgi:N-acetylglucosaminyl-diphospho-decaprenol L-rhamnosyltransferase
LPSIDVAIVNWNTADLALRAAESFRASQGVEAAVTIVDNNSRREQRGLLREKQGDSIRLHLAERNLGYGVAANLALEGGDAELVCVSNADLRPRPDALSLLAEVALDCPGAGMVGPVFEGGSNHYHARLPRPTSLLARPFFGSAGKGPSISPRPGRVAVAGQVSGACFVMRRALWEEIGGFDEGYFLWYDDVDLAKRLHDRGKRNLVVGAAAVEHRGAGSFSQIESRVAQAIRLASLERYIAKHHPRLAPIARPPLRLSARLRARGARPPGDDG